jgi:RNA polymerase sigma factor (sigma-70 family)
MTVKEYNICVENFSDSIYRFALKTLGNSDKARDIVQDSFERLWIRHENVDFQKSKSYLFTTAYHACIDSIRMDKRQGAIEEVKESRYSTSNDFSDLQEILHDALAKLPEIQRSVILLRDYEGYSYQEIEELTGLTEAQVKVYIYRARLAMKEYIGQIERVL